jgi:PAS domain S-box-containing protein
LRYSFRVRAPPEPTPADPVPSRPEHLKRLQRLTEALSAAATLGEVTGVVLDRALGLVEARAVVVFWERRPGELELVQGLGMTEEYASGYRRVFADEPLPCAEAYRTGQVVWLRSQADVAKRFPTLVPFARRERMEAWAAFPITSGGTKGSVGLQFAVPRAFDDDEKAFLLAAVRQCAHAVERARVFDAHKRLAERLQHLQLTAATLSVASPPRDVAAVAFRALGAVGACAAEIHALAGHERLALVARHGRPTDEASAPMVLEAPVPAAEVVRTGRALWLDSTEIALRYPHLEADREAREEGSWAVVPLLASGRALGALTVAFRQARPLEADERTFVRLVAQLCAAALDRAQLFEEAKRSRAEAESTAALLGAAWAAAPMALALVDREGRFVRVNEAFAHLAGVRADAQAGRTPAEVLPGVAGEQISAAVEEALSTGAPVEREVLGETRAEAGKTRTLSTRASPVRVEASTVGVALVVHER